MLTLSSIVLSALTLLDPVDARPFAVPSADGTMIHGQADRPDHAAAGVVIMVAGTGAFDRDVRFSEQADARPVFLDLSDRLTARGVTVVRYDKRGVRYGATGADRIDAAEIVTATTDAQRQDLAAVHDWARADEGLGARCVVLFGHSEGMVHIGRLAASGAPAPAAVVGMGALLADPVSNFRWNLAERDAYSLRLMDADGDGVTTNAEVRANLAVTPAVVNGTIEPYLHPSGAWTTADIAAIEQAWVEAYPMMRDATLAMADDAPWPSAEAPSSVWQWAKSWYIDETPVAANLARWNTPVLVHLGDRDSQTHAPLQQAAGQAALGERLTVRLHAGVGHTLGAHPTYGPMTEDLADQVADDVAAALGACAASG
jgi:dienelactone hydrolase